MGQQQQQQQQQQQRGDGGPADEANDSGARATSFFAKESGGGGEAGRETLRSHKPAASRKKGPLTPLLERERKAKGGLLGCGFRRGFLQQKDPKEKRSKSRKKGKKEGAVIATAAAPATPPPAPGGTSPQDRERASAAVPGMVPTRRLQFCDPEAGVGKAAMGDSAARPAAAIDATTATSTATVALKAKRAKTRRVPFKELLAESMQSRMSSADKLDAQKQAVQVGLGGGHFRKVEKL